MKEQKQEFYIERKKKAYLLFAISVLIAPMNTFYWEDGYVDLAIYQMNPGFRLERCFPFFDANHY